MTKFLVLGISFLLVKNTVGQCDSLFFRNAATFVYDLVLLDSNRLIAVGDNGYVIKSADGGRSWRNIPTFQPYFLRSVYPATDSVIYAVGAWKTVLKSEDQGETWYPLYAKVSGPTNASAFFNDVFFFNKDTGFIVGDDAKLISTKDGGRSWKDTIFTIVSSSRLNSITFVNDTLGFICGGSNSMFRTKNRGATWEKINLDFLGFNRNIVKVRFLDHLNGFAAGGDGIFIKTTDGGNTWTRYNTPTGSGSIFNDIFFFNTQTGFIAGTYGGGIILKTTDGGITWNVQPNSFEGASSCYTIAADPAKKKIVFAGGGSGGDFLGYNGRNILSTIDSGATYQKLSTNGAVDFYDIFFLNDSTGYITGNYGLTYKTNDYGESWQSLQYIPALFGSNPARNIFFINEQYGYAATDRIYKTNDGGNSWNLVSIPGVELQFVPRRMHFFDSLKGLVMDHLTMYKTFDGGSTWVTVLNTNSFFRDFYFNSNGKGFVVGYNGQVSTTQDQGDTWQPVNLNTTEFLTCVYFLNNNIGFIGGADSTLYKTIDGGINWTPIKVEDHTEIHSLLFLNDTLGYMMRVNNGGASEIYKSSNGGLSWIRLYQVLEDLSRFAGGKSIYTAGESGFIFKTDKLTKPTIPGYIYNSSAINCTNSTSYFVTGLMTNMDYTWTLSGGSVSKYKQNLDTVSWNNSPGTYTLSVSVSNACGVSPSRHTDLTVHESTSINTQPDSKRICLGSSVSFNVGAVGSSISYQWKKNGNDITGATNNSYTISSVAVADAASYSVTVKGICGTVNSSFAGLTLLPPDSCVTAVTTVNSPLEMASLLPNLVRENATLKIVVSKNVKMNWSVLDLGGKTVMKFNNQPPRGDNYYTMSFQHLSSGIYFIRGSIGNNTVKLIKFVKL